MGDKEEKGIKTNLICAFFLAVTSTQNQRKSGGNLFKVILIIIGAATIRPVAIEIASIGAVIIKLVIIEAVIIKPAIAESVVIILFDAHTSNN